MKKVPTDVEEFAQKIAQEEDSGMYEAMANTVVDKKDNPSIHELAKEFPEKTYKELERYRNENRHQEAGSCIMGEMRKDREEKPTKVNLDYRKSLEDAARASQPAWESEVSALKQQLHTDREEFQSSLDQVKKENNELFNRIAELTEIDESHQRLNGKLQVRIAELEDENQKIHKHLDKQVEESRKAGM